MGTARTAYNNGRYIKARYDQIKERGSKCQLCESPWKDDLVFAHKIGFRWMYGISRGRNARVLEVRKYPERFLLLCHCCHRNYDRLHPLTPEEIEMSEKLKRETVPF